MTSFYRNGRAAVSFAAPRNTGLLIVAIRWPSIRFRTERALCVGSGWRHLGPKSRDPALEPGGCTTLRPPRERPSPVAFRRSPTAQILQYKTRTDLSSALLLTR